MFKTAILALVPLSHTTIYKTIFGNRSFTFEFSYVHDTNHFISSKDMIDSFGFIVVLITNVFCKNEQSLLSLFFHLNVVYIFIQITMPAFILTTFAFFYAAFICTVYANLSLSTYYQYSLSLPKKCSILYV